MADITQKYTQEDFDGMTLKLMAVMDYAKLLRCYDIKDDGPCLALIALTLETLIEPVIDFLDWADTYASIPDDDESIADA